MARDRRREVSSQARNSAGGEANNREEHGYWETVRRRPPLDPVSGRGSSSCHLSTGLLESALSSPCSA
jgi:hypothetical protein